VVTEPPATSTVTVLAVDRTSMNAGGPPGSRSRRKNAAH
jgi:hypothetical protein